MNGGSSIRTYKRALDSCAYGLCCVQKADGSWLAPSSHRHSQRPKACTSIPHKMGLFRFYVKSISDYPKGQNCYYLETVLNDVNFDFGEFQIWQNTIIHKI